MTVREVHQYTSRHQYYIYTKAQTANEFNARDMKSLIRNSQIFINSSQPFSHSLKPKYSEIDVKQIPIL